jgi:hypothetical protein
VGSRPDESGPAVETFGLDGAHETLGVGAAVRRPRTAEDGLARVRGDAAAELSPQDSVLFTQVLEDVPPVADEPGDGDDGEKLEEWGRGGAGA